MSVVNATINKKIKFYKIGANTELVINSILMYFSSWNSRCVFPPFFLDGKNNGGSKRYSRKREPTFAKAESFPGPRRSQPQKNKSFDKRPPQRGGAGVRQYELAGGGRREEVSYDSYALDCKVVVRYASLLHVNVKISVIMLVNELLRSRL